MAAPAPSVCRSVDIGTAGNRQHRAQSHSPDHDDGRAVVLHFSRGSKARPYLLSRAAMGKHVKCKTVHCEQDARMRKCMKTRMLRLFSHKAEPGHQAWK